MLFGHNSNVTLGKDVIHVQTEDRGESHAFIDTTVHWKGRVLHRRTSNYLDLLPLDATREAALKSRLDEQHRRVIEEIRSGALKLTFPAWPQTAGAQAATHESGLKLELTNARNWLAGKRALLHLIVRDREGTPLQNAQARARVEGAENLAEFSAQTGSDGRATLEFDMPTVNAGEAALVIEAAHDGAKGHLRFQLRHKPKGRG
jgi:hypothetical protein